jgi:hypothetical protein
MLVDLTLFRRVCECVWVYVRGYMHMGGPVTCEGLPQIIFKGPDTHTQLGQTMFRLCHYIAQECC